MQALVVYESMFGNTEVIARAIAEGLSSAVHTEVQEVHVAPADPFEIEDLELLVVGGPTHAFSMTRASTREDAARQAGAVPEPGMGLREWLTDLRPAPRRIASAAFDTKIDHPRLPGSAAAAATKRLRRMGFAIAAPAHSFYVADVKGPLVQGERERAHDWGVEMGRAAVSTAGISTAG
jgi:hypothetical protein